MSSFRKRDFLPDLPLAVCLAVCARFVPKEQQIATQQEQEQGAKTLYKFKDVGPNMIGLAV